MFEYQALVTSLYHGNNSCPVCRTAFGFGDVYHSINLQRIISASHSDTSTQTEDIPELLSDATTQTESSTTESATQMDMPQPMFTSVLSTFITPNVVDNSDDHVPDTYFSPTVDYFRVVNIDQAAVNPNSTSVGDDQYIIESNKRFNGVVGLNKYIYQTLTSNITDVAHTLADTGYLVYDIFCINAHSPRPLYRYMLYSSPLKANKTRHYLSRYTRRGDC